MSPLASLTPPQRAALRAELDRLDAQPQAVPSAPASPAPVPAGIRIPVAMRVRNKTGAQCVWASMDTISLYLRLGRLPLLTNYYQGTADPEQVQSVLTHYGVRFRQSRSRAELTGFLEAAFAQGLPVGVGLEGRHMVVAEALEGSQVRVVENMDGQEHLYPLALLDGWAVVLYPDGTDGVQTAPPSPAPPISRRAAPQLVPAPCPGGT